MSLASEQDARQQSRLMYQYSYFCTSKVSGVSICTFVPVVPARVPEVACAAAAEAAGERGDKVSRRREREGIRRREREER